MNKYRVGMKVKSLGEPLFKYNHIRVEGVVYHTTLFGGGLFVDILGISRRLQDDRGYLTAYGDYGFEIIEEFQTNLERELHELNTMGYRYGNH